RRVGAPTYSRCAPAHEPWALPFGLRVLGVLDVLSGSLISCPPSAFSLQPSASLPSLRVLRGPNPLRFFAASAPLLGAGREAEFDAFAVAVAQRACGGDRAGGRGLPQQREHRVQRGVVGHGRGEGRLPVAQLLVDEGPLDELAVAEIEDERAA